MTGPEIVEEVATTIHAGMLGDDPLTEIAKAALLATLDAIREPSEAILFRAAAEMPQSMRASWIRDARNFLCGYVDALRREIAG